jgi:hypothetical protein
MPEDTNAPEGTPLPEALTQDQEFAGFKTVEDLAKGYKGTKASIGSIEQIPEELRKDPNISKYKTLDEFAKGHLSLSKMIAAKGVIVPTDDAPQEEKDKFLNAVGRPEKVEGYNFTPLEKVHPEIAKSLTPENELAFKKLMHDAGATQAVADKLHKIYYDTASQALAAKDETTAKAMKDGEAALRQKWGTEYEIKLANAKKIVTKFGGQEAVDALGDLGSHPAIVKMIAEIASNFSEDQIKNFGDNKQEGVNSAKEKIKVIMSDPKSAYNDEKNPKHNEAVKEVTKLYQEAYPEVEQ